MNLLVFPLCHSEFDAETYCVAYHNLGQHSQEAEPPHAQHGGFAQLAGSQCVLITDIVHSEEQSRNQGDDDKADDSLAVDGIMNVHTSRATRRTRHEGKRLQTVEKALEGMKLTALLEVRLYLVEIIS